MTARKRRLGTERLATWRARDHALRLQQQQQQSGEPLSDMQDDPALVLLSKFILCVSYLHAVILAEIPRFCEVL